MLMVRRLPFILILSLTNLCLQTSNHNWCFTIGCAALRTLRILSVSATTHIDTHWLIDRLFTYNNIMLFLFVGSSNYVLDIGIERLLWRA